MAKFLPNVCGIILLSPGAFGAWADGFVQGILGKASPPVTLVRLSFTEPLPDISFHVDERIVLISDYPPAGLAGLIAESMIPVVCFVDPPHAAIRFLMAWLDISFIEALRRYTAATTVFPLLAGSHALILRRSDRHSPAQMEGAILRHIGLAADTTPCSEAGAEEDFESVLAREVQPYVPPTVADADDKECRIVTDVTSAVFASLDGHFSEPIVWRREVLSWASQPGSEAPAFIDIAGANRVLYHGPYFYLPAATYRLQAHVGFSEEAIGHPFALEVHGVECIARTDFSPSFAGWCLVGFTFLHSAASDRLEVHLTSMRGALRGRVALNTVSFIPQQ